MNTNRLTLGIATFALVTTTASLLLFVGCSNSSTTADGGAPTNRDSGADSTTTGDSGKDGGSNGSDSASDASEKDAVSLETPDCASEASTCNTCYSDAQAVADPYNACSPYTAGCVPFTLTVPTHPQLP
jgi:hypothetical protein